MEVQLFLVLGIVFCAVYTGIAISFYFNLMIQSLIIKNIRNTLPPKQRSGLSKLSELVETMSAGALIWPYGLLQMLKNKNEQ